MPQAGRLPPLLWVARRGQIESYVCVCVCVCEERLVGLHKLACEAEAGERRQGRSFACGIAL